MRESRQRWARRTAAAAAAAAACLLANGARAEDSLCAPGEPVVFSCQAGSKTVSLCRPSSLRQELIYRFGTRQRLELVYPGSGLRTAPGFELSHAPLVGGGVTSVTFRRGAYQYRIYSKTSHGDDPGHAPQFEDGLVVARNGKPVRHLVCDDGGEGFREELDWLPKAVQPR